MSGGVNALVRSRDGFRCTECGLSADEHVARYGRTLDVHRVDPALGYSLENCVTLWRPCHIPKPRSPRGQRRRWPSGRRIVALSERLMQVVDAQAERNCQTLAQEVHDLVREALTARGLWPPPAPPKGRKS